MVGRGEPSEADHTKIKDYLSPGIKPKIFNLILYIMNSAILLLWIQSRGVKVPPIHALI